VRGNDRHLKCKEKARLVLLSTKLKYSHIKGGGGVFSFQVREYLKRSFALIESFLYVRA